MKRIDILKGVEQILVQKAYETGHISHRADGDWQKQADGSWKPYTGQSNQNFKKYDARTRFGGDGTLLTQDQVKELLQIDDINERKKRQKEMLAENKKDSDSSYEEVDPKSCTPSPSDSVTDDARSDVDSGKFDDLIRGIEMRENDDGELVPQDDDYFTVADEIIEQMDYDEDDYDELYDTIVNSVIDRRYALDESDTSVAQEMNNRILNKSVKVKNLGF